MNKINESLYKDEYINVSITKALSRLIKNLIFNRIITIDQPTDVQRLRAGGKKM